ncbi:MAG: hypothetical protein AAB296_05650, partial [Candidatus Desantisbacteria bacterium]
IRQRHYTVKAGELCYRPYRICPDKADAHSFSEFKKGVKMFFSKWPRNKQKEFREILTLGENAAQQFITEMKNRDNTLPEIWQYPDFKNKVWDGQGTPYFDMLELVEFYPVDKIEEESQ